MEKNSRNEIVLICFYYFIFIVVDLNYQELFIINQIYYCEKQILFNQIKSLILEIIHFNTDGTDGT